MLKTKLLNAKRQELSISRFLRQVSTRMPYTQVPRWTEYPILATEYHVTWKLHLSIDPSRSLLLGLRDILYPSARSLKSPWFHSSMLILRILRSTACGALRGIECDGGTQFSGISVLWLYSRIWRRYWSKPGWSSLRKVSFEISYSMLSGIKGRPKGAREKNKYIQGRIFFSPQFRWTN